MTNRRASSLHDLGRECQRARLARRRHREPCQSQAVNEHSRERRHVGAEGEKRVRNRSSRTGVKRRRGATYRFVRTAGEGQGYWRKPAGRK